MEQENSLNKNNVLHDQDKAWADHIKQEIVNTLSSGTDQATLKEFLDTLEWYQVDDFKAILTAYPHPDEVINFLQENKKTIFTIHKLIS
jgi:Tat protein secretion system quality control protein TatD with DNase activity